MGTWAPFPTREGPRAEDSLAQTAASSLGDTNKHKQRQKNMQGCKTSYVPHTGTALAGKPPPNRQSCQCHKCQGQWLCAQLPAGRTACLAHQLVPRDGAEEGVGLQLCHATSSRAQALLRVVLQELQRKGTGQQNGDMGIPEKLPRLDPAFPQPLNHPPSHPPKPLTSVSSDVAARLSPSGRCSWV